MGWGQSKTAVAKCATVVGADCRHRGIVAGTTERFVSGQRAGKSALDGFVDAGDPAGVTTVDDAAGDGERDPPEQPTAAPTRHAAITRRTTPERLIGPSSREPGCDAVAREWHLGSA